MTITGALIIILFWFVFGLGFELIRTRRRVEALEHTIQRLDRPMLCSICGAFHAPLRECPRSRPNKNHTIPK